MAPYQGTNEVDFEEMYADREEDQFVIAGTNRRQLGKVVVVDDEDDSPLTELDGEGEDGRRSVRTIPEEEDEQGHRGRVRNVDILQDVLNGVWDSLRTQHEELAEMRATQAVELDRQRMRNREDERRYQAFTHNLIEAQRKLITFASTRGYEVPGVEDFALSSHDSNESNRTPTEDPGEGVAEVKPKVAEQRGASNDSRSESPPVPTPESSIAPPRRHDPGQTHRQQHHAEQQAPPGKDRVTRLQEAGLLGSSSASRAGPPPAGWYQPREQRGRQQNGGGGQGRRHDGRAARGAGGPPDDSSSSDSKGAPPRGGREPNDRSGRRRREEDSDEDDSSMPRERTPRVHQAGPQSAPARGINPRYIVPVSRYDDRRQPQQRNPPTHAVRPGWTDGEDVVAYKDNTREWIRAVVRQDLDFEPEDLPVLNKNVKLNMPAQYASEDDVEVYGDWVLDVTRFCRMTRMVG